MNTMNARYLNPNTRPKPMAPAPVAADTGPAPNSSTPDGANSASVRILLEIDHQRIRCSVRQQMGPYLTMAGRIWRRLARGQWRTVDPDWSVHEGTLGCEVIDYLAGLDFPARIAEMLPRRPGDLPPPATPPDEAIAIIDALRQSIEDGTAHIGGVDRLLVLSRLRERVHALSLQAEALEQLVALADREPFTTLGHAVEHAVPHARALAVSTEQQAEVSHG